MSHDGVVGDRQPADLAQLRLVASFLTIGNEEASNSLIERTLAKAKQEASAKPAGQTTKVWLCRLMLDLARNLG